MILSNPEYPVKGIEGMGNHLCLVVKAHSICSVNMSSNTARLEIKTMHEPAEPRLDRHRLPASRRAALA
jgi:hypothetical protein